MRGWIDWFAKGLWKRRKGLGVLLGLTLLFTAIVLYQNRNFRPAPTIEDPGFVTAANAVCEKTIPALRAKPREEKSEENLEQETAAAIERILPKLEAVVAELRTLDVEPANEAKVQKWFGDFDAYIEAGRTYAAALRTGDDDAYDKADDAAVQPLKNISNFARANRIDDCIP